MELLILGETNFVRLHMTHIAIPDLEPVMGKTHRSIMARRRLRGP